MISPLIDLFWKLITTIVQVRSRDARRGARTGKKHSLSKAGGLFGTVAYLWESFSAASECALGCPAIHSTVQTEPRRVININSNDMSMYSQFDERCLCAERWLRGGKEATQSLPFRTAIGTPPVVQIAGINVGLLLASLVSLWGAVLWRPARGFTSQASGAPLVNTPRKTGSSALPRSLCNTPHEVFSST